ncbi:MAG: RIP metalloprotease RseP [Clostridium sp.]|nr:RIP metalloprotease RseP [Prevotella sp.]MCM1428169.1 RIP metalloprotease RseP [Clostridium sp.]MCM1474700.1 RIP metalloprotease RseP [Muribaculaceae bacterium]
MEVFLIKAAQLVLALAILIIIHEFGHFFFARLFGVRVEKFYIFFDPWTELFRWRPRKYIGGLGRVCHKGDEARQYTDHEMPEEIDEEAVKASISQIPEHGRNKAEKVALKAAKEKAEKEAYSREAAKQEALGNAEAEECKREGWLRRFWGHTEYGIGWIPLGGYCKISGMIDESMDTEQMKRPPKDWEFRSKPAWQRLLIMIAGVLFNFLLAIIIYAGIVYATGEKYVRFEDAKNGMAFSPAAQQAGFRDGDIPLLADGEKLDDPADARMAMLQAKTVTVLRDGKRVDIAIPEKMIFALDEEAKKGETPIQFMTYRIPTRVTQTVSGEGAEAAGIKVGDEIIAIDTIPTPTLDVFLPTLDGRANKTVDITVVRREGKATPDTLKLPVKLSANSKMGIGLEIDPSAFYKAQEKHYSLLESVPRGIEMGTSKLTDYAKSMKLVFTKEGAQSVGGFGSIGSIFPEKWDWIAFWNIAAFLSVALAFMNILPIPALDGGHVLFLLYEVIFRRKPSEKFLEHAQMVGMILLILLLLYANGMDIVRFFK